MYVKKQKKNKDGSNKVYIHKNKGRKYTDTLIHKYFFLALSPAPPLPFFCH